MPIAQSAHDPAEIVIQRALPRNFCVNVIEHAFLWLGLSFASRMTILPLFVSRLTDSLLAISLLSAVWEIGWFFPQLLTANHVQHLVRKKPFVLAMSIQARLPYVLIAGIALGLLHIGPGLGLVSFFVVFAWICLAGGFTATPWQEMIAKIIPTQRRGILFGMQNFVGGLLGAAGAVLAGRLLELYAYPVNFAICFALASVIMAISLVFLGATVEPSVVVSSTCLSQREYWHQLPTVLCENPNFARFLLARAVALVGTMGVGFLTIHTARRLGATPSELGVFTAVSLVTETGADLGLGLWGDRTGHKRMLEFAGLCAIGAMTCAWLADTLTWFYLAYALVGVAMAGDMVSFPSITLEFGPPTQRPTYIGLANTLLAPFAGFAPLLGGWLVGVIGYPAMFALAALLSLFGLGLLHFGVYEPRHLWSVTEAHG